MMDDERLVVVVVVVVRLSLSTTIDPTVAQWGRDSYSMSFLSLGHCVTAAVCFYTETVGCGPFQHDLLIEDLLSFFSFFGPHISHS